MFCILPSHLYSSFLLLSSCLSLFLQFLVSFLSLSPPIFLSILCPLFPSPFLYFCFLSCLCLSFPSPPKFSMFSLFPSLLLFYFLALPFTSSHPFLSCSFFPLQPFCFLNLLVLFPFSVSPTLFFSFLSFHFTYFLISFSLASFSFVLPFLSSSFLSFHFLQFLSSFSFV